MSEEWYYVGAGNAQVGPVTKNELKTVFTNKQINFDTLVWTAALSGWQACGTLPDLKAFLEPPAPAPAPAAAPAGPAR